jgi:hypothetical protein
LEPRQAQAWEPGPEPTQDWEPGRGVQTLVCTAERGPTGPALNRV